MISEFSIYNSLSGKIEKFEPRNDEVTVYVCGITPYDTTHLGHMFTYSAVDVLIRYLEYCGYRIRYVQNLTDVDDPLFRKAREEKEDWRDLGRYWTRRYIEDMKTMNILPPDQYPKATEVIAEMTGIIRKLLEKGVAYKSQGGVYFNVDAWEDFGKLSRIPREEMLAIANEMGNDPDDPAKRNPLDFELWRRAKPDEPSWDSPWGEGRPGWHIECSTMAGTLLGETIDIHGGGSDLMFPHHESEIAQSECATGKKPFVRYWFHTAMVRHEGKKMSKSTGNLVMLHDLLEDYSPDVIRLFLSRHHYREPWEFDESELQDAARLVDKLRDALRAPEGAFGAPGPDTKKIRREFSGILNDDLNTRDALRKLDEFADMILQAAGAGSNILDARLRLRDLCYIFGLRLDKEDSEERVIKKWNEHATKFKEDGNGPHA